MMFKKVTGKTLSLILAVMMLASLLPLSAAALPLKVSESFGGFTAEQLETTYTSTNQFKTANVTAPYEKTSGGVRVVSATPKKDDDNTEYLHIEPTATATGLIGGIRISDSNLNVGTQDGQNNTLTFSTKMRKNFSSDNVYITLITEDGSRFNNYIVRLWGSGSGRIDYYTGASTNTGLGNVAANTWYDITMTWNLKTNNLLLKIDGGTFDNASVTLTGAKAITTTADAPVTGVMIGWNENYTHGDTQNHGFDIASMSLSNVGSTTQITKDELLFENSTLGAHAAVAGSGEWTDGNWKIQKWMFTETRTGRNKTEVVSTGDSHDMAMKLTEEASSPYWLENIPATALTGKVVIEAAYKDAGDQNSQMRLLLTDSNGTAKQILKAKDTTGQTFIFCDAEETILEPDTTDWLRMRLIVDLESDTAEVSYWSEGNPTDIVTYYSPEGDTSFTGALTDIANVRFEPFGRSADTVMYIDNPSVSSGSVTLYAEDVAPANNATKVSVGVKPAISFNAPVKVAEIFTLTDEDGNTVAGTAGLTADGRGLAFYPAEELKPATTYTLTANGTVTDVFGDTAAVNETITFTTDDVIAVNDVTFGGAISEGALIAGDLTATVDITTCDGAARDILVLIGLYDSTTKELKDFDVDYQNTADYDNTLTVTVPETGSYYPVVYIWNNYSSLKPYVAPITLD